MVPNVVQKFRPKKRRLCLFSGLQNGPFLEYVDRESETAEILSLPSTNHVTEEG